MDAYDNMKTYDSSKKDVSKILVLIACFFVYFMQSDQHTYYCFLDRKITKLASTEISLYHKSGSDITSIMWVKFFRIIPEFRILRLTFHRKSDSKC